jgi:hypothetical protein
MFLKAGEQALALTASLIGETAAAMTVVAMADAARSFPCMLSVVNQRFNWLKKLENIFPAKNAIDRALLNQRHDVEKHRPSCPYDASNNDPAPVLHPNPAGVGRRELP